MAKNIEAEVKKILRKGTTGVKVTSNGVVNFIEYPISEDALAKEICHLFPKTPDNPDGYVEEKPTKRRRYGLPADASQRRM